MRIYCSNYLAGVPEKIEPFFVTNRIVTHLISEDDKFLVNDNKLYRLLETKTPLKKTMIGVFPATLKSEPYDTKVCYQIPPNSKQDVFVYKVYKLSPQSDVEYIFVFKQNSDVLIENYFSVPDGAAPINRADILKLLSWRTITTKR